MFPGGPSNTFEDKSTLVQVMAIIREPMLTQIYITKCITKPQWVYLILKHDDVIKWKHFPRYWPFVRGIHRSPVNSPHKGQWRGALVFSLICAWINGWVNNREAGDSRRHRAHYDVIVMTNWRYPLSLIQSLLTRGDRPSSCRLPLMKFTISSPAASDQYGFPHVGAMNER